MNANNIMKGHNKVNGNEREKIKKSLCQVMPPKDRITVIRALKTSALEVTMTYAFVNACRYGLRCSNDNKGFQLHRSGEFLYHLCMDTRTR